MIFFAIFIELMMLCAPAAAAASSCLPYVRMRSATSSHGSTVRRSTGYFLYFFLNEFCAAPRPLRRPKPHVWSIYVSAAIGIIYNIYYNNNKLILYYNIIYNILLYYY
jgi:hypothetical protein